MARLSKATIYFNQRKDAVKRLSPEDRKKYETLTVEYLRLSNEASAVSQQIRALLGLLRHYETADRITPAVQNVSPETLKGKE